MQLVFFFLSSLPCWEWKPVPCTLLCVRSPPGFLLLFPAHLCMHSGQRTTCEKPSLSPFDPWTPPSCSCSPCELCFFPTLEVEFLHDEREPAGFLQCPNQGHVEHCLSSHLVNHLILSLGCPHLPHQFPEARAPML